MYATEVNYFFSKKKCSEGVFKMSKRVWSKNKASTLWSRVCPTAGETEGPKMSRFYCSWALISISLSHFYSNLTKMSWLFHLWCLRSRHFSFQQIEKRFQHHIISLSYTECSSQKTLIWKVKDFEKSYRKSWTMSFLSEQNYRKGAHISVFEMKLPVKESCN